MQYEKSNTVRNGEMVEIEERIIAFKQDLKIKKAQDIVHKYITCVDCFALEEEIHLSLRQEVGRHYCIHPSHIVVVGSAKLGFSIAPHKRYKAFGEDSDIDVVMCYGPLFDAIWSEVYSYYLREGTWDHLNEFRKYLFKGWIRPDILPPEKSFARSKDWWEYFRQTTASGKFGPYKICGALYKDWSFLDAYQENCVIECQRQENGSI
jgi:hypothetical protein